MRNAARAGALGWRSAMIPRRGSGSCWPRRQRSNRPVSTTIKRSKKHSATAGSMASCAAETPTPTTSASVASRRRSAWSKRNIEIAERLIAAGRMHQAGIAELESARADGRSEAAYAGSASIEVPDDLGAALAAEPKALAMFENLNRQTATRSFIGSAPRNERKVPERGSSRTRRNAGPRRDDPPTETHLIQAVGAASRVLHACVVPP